MRRTIPLSQNFSGIHTLRLNLHGALFPNISIHSAIAARVVTIQSVLEIPAPRFRLSLSQNLCDAGCWTDCGTTIPADILWGWFHTHGGTRAQSVAGF